ncbi:MAG: intradiol ring-cleavage dioxygenase [Steroidobacteraceae bacterium]
MRDFDEFNITQSVIERFDNTPDPRLKQILQSLVTHLHDFVRDVDLSFEEWQAAIGFLTRTGQKCSDTRQEFILLSDTLGVSMLVDAINHRKRGGATETTVLGPFFVNNAPRLPLGSDISGSAEGEPLYVSGKVCSADGTPLSNALIEIWQSDSEGFYDVQRSDELNLRGGFRSDAQGNFNFWTILPSCYPIPYDGPVGDMLQATKRHPYRPAHVHFMILAKGYEDLTTHVFVNGDQYLDSDAVFGVKNSLIRDFEHHAPGAAPDGRVMNKPWRSLAYEFRLKAATAA